MYPGWRGLSKGSHPNGNTRLTSHRGGGIEILRIPDLMSHRGGGIASRGRHISCLMFPRPGFSLSAREARRKMARKMAKNGEESGAEGAAEKKLGFASLFPGSL